MEIFGVGGLELVAILLIMLVVAGPQRMIRWSFVLGQYAGKMRGMWRETALLLQKELDDAGVDVKVPQQVPTRHTMNREMAKVFSPLTQPLNDALKAEQPIESASREG